MSGGAEHSPATPGMNALTNAAAGHRTERANEAILIGLLAHQGSQTASGSMATLPGFQAMVFTTKIDW
jgi:hypothetical protein